MAVWTLGSINEDRFYSLPQLPGPGETVAAADHRIGLGGKGANQSVAAARAGAVVHHIGMIGVDGDWALGRLEGLGVDTRHVGRTDGPTGHAMIMVAADGENAIVVHAGANAMQDEARITAALNAAAPGDIFLLQNETSVQILAAGVARERGLQVVYSAAPFAIETTQAVLPHVSVLVLNEVEHAQLTAALGRPEGPEVVVTRGARGATWSRPGAEMIDQPAFTVSPVDTTGAGDCFTGTLAAGLDQGLDRPLAMRRAAAAAALQVARPGTADAMPARTDIDAFLALQGQ